MDVHESEVMRKLKTFVGECGSQSMAASALQVTPQYLSLVLLGKRNIGPSILSKLKIKRSIRQVITYATR